MNNSIKKIKPFILTLILPILCHTSLALSDDHLDTAIFAGGCFWCMEPPFEKLEGVISVESGYSGGKLKNPDYKTVSSGQTQHIEVIKVTFDTTKITYSELLPIYWRNVDPTDANGQFCDKGYQYTTAIFFNSPQQQQLAEDSKTALLQDEQFAQAPIVTPIREAKMFYPAESYHQDYYKRNPIRYKFYRYNCGRDKRLNELWGKPS